MNLTQSAHSPKVYFLEEVPGVIGYSCPYAAHSRGCYSLCPMFRLSEATDPGHKPVPGLPPTHFRLTLECSPNGRIFLGDLPILEPPAPPEPAPEPPNGGAS